MVATTEFETLAREAARAQGLGDARVATLEHPVGGIGQDALIKKAESLVDAVLACLTPEKK